MAYTSSSQAHLIAAIIEAWPHLLRWWVWTLWLVVSLFLWSPRSKPRAPVPFGFSLLFLWKLFGVA